MSDLPRVTATGLTYLRRFAEDSVTYVYRDPGKPGSGVSKPALDRLRRDGLVELGDYEALHGKPIRVTDLGRAVLAASADPFAGHHRHCYVREGAHCSCGHTDIFGVRKAASEEQQ